MDYDVVIVGGGPTGGIVGEAVAKNGYKVCIIEEHREIGKPLQCAGLVSKNLLKEFQFKKNIILNSFNGANFSIGEKKLKIEAKENKAYVIDRPMLDREIITNSIRAGCDIFLGKRVEGIKKVSEGWEVFFGGKKIFGKVLVGADGVQSNVSLWSGLKRPKEIISCIQAHCIGKVDEINKVSIFVGKEIAPNFFSWLIPLNENEALIGVGANSNASYFLRKILKNKLILSHISSPKPISYFSGCIPIGFSEKTYGDRVLSVGDSAGQVKPLTGGGLYTGIVCARICGDTITKFLSSNYSLHNYQKAWRKKIVKELSFGEKIRKVFISLSDEKLSEIITFLNDKDIKKIISIYGDIDAHFGLYKLLFKKFPKLVKFALPIIKSFL